MNSLDKIPTSNENININNNNEIYVPQTLNQNKKLNTQTTNFRKFVSTQSIVAPEKDEELEYEKIKDSKFKQQRLPAWRPVPTILSIIIVFSLFGISFIIIGIFILIYAKKIKTQEIDYTNCKLNASNFCNEEIKLDKTIEQPVFVYYQLDGFFQNTRRYLKSKEIDQLTGDDANIHDNCEPAETNEEMGFSSGKKAYDGKTDLIMNNIAIPCGLIAKTYFNDKFTFYINNEHLNVDDTNIAFDRDKKIFNKDIDLSKQWISLKDEHFLVWMRPSGLPNPMKLWGKIEQDLKKDDIIRIEIDYKYDVKHYDGKKKIILSNTTIFGGNNTFMGICYIVVGILSLICVIIFLIGYKIQMKKEKEL